jgi:hypothetical protein
MPTTTSDLSLAGPEAFLPARALWYNVEKGFGIVAADRGGKTSSFMPDSESEQVE